MNNKGEIVDDYVNGGDALRLLPESTVDAKAVGRSIPKAATWEALFTGGRDINR